MLTSTKTRDLAGSICESWGLVTSESQYANWDLLDVYRLATSGTPDFLTFMQSRYVVLKPMDSDFSAEYGKWMVSNGQLDFVYMLQLNQFHWFKQTCFLHIMRPPVHIIDIHILCILDAIFDVWLPWEHPENIQATSQTMSCYIKLSVSPNFWINESMNDEWHFWYCKVSSSKSEEISVSGLTGIIWT